jgi:hypothetical protein
MSSMFPPLTEDSPDSWDLMATEVTNRWRTAHPRRALIAELLALKRRKQGREGGKPHLLEMVERHPFQAFKAHRQWLLHLVRLRAEGKDNIDGTDGLEIA